MSNHEEAHRAPDNPNTSEGSRTILSRTAFLIFAATAVCLHPASVQSTPVAKPAPETASKPATSAPTVKTAAGVRPADTVPAAKPATTNEFKGTIMLPTAGEYTWWVTPVPGKKTQPPKLIKGDRIEWTAPIVFTATPIMEVFILNNASGKVAPVNAAQASKTGELKLVDSDFSIVHRLQVRVSAKDGKPVRVASVGLKDAHGNTQQRLIDDASNGIAEFYDVATGAASLTAGSGDISVTQDIKVGAALKDKADHAEVILAGNVPTLAPEKAKKSSGGGKTKSKSNPNSVTGLVTTLLSLLVLGGIGYIIYLMAKNKNLSGSMKMMLEKAGVPLEDNQPSVVPAPEAPTAPPLDPNLVGPAPTMAPGAPSATPSVSGPRLVGLAGTYSGAVFPLTTASAILGREATNEIALTDDGTASRRHARITNSGGTVVVHDEGSSNGTFVNGQKIVEHELRSGDELQVGSTRFRYED